MVEKKAYVRTLEVMTAIIITTVFFLYFIPQYSGSSLSESGFDILNQLMYNDDFRNFIVGNEGCYSAVNATSINSYIEIYLTEGYDYYVCIDEKTSNIPDSKTFLDSIMISGNMTTYNPKIVRLYYWPSE